MKFKTSKWLTAGLSAAVILALSTVTANAAGGKSFSGAPEFNREIVKQQIPVTFEPGTYLTYDAELNPVVTNDTSAADHAGDKSQFSSAQPEVPDIDGRAAEDAFFKAVAESVKHLPVIDLGYGLPAPSPGTVVIYGSDGHINRIYVDEKIASRPTSAAALIDYFLGWDKVRFEGTYSYMYYAG